MAGNELVANFGEFKRRRESGSASMADLIQKLKAHVATQRNKLLEGFMHLLKDAQDILKGRGMQG